MHYGQTLKYAFHVIFHPVDGFWDLKREKKGSLSAAFTIVLLTILTLTLEKQKTGFLFNTYRLEYINVVVDIMTVMLLYVLWSVSGWCLTSLMDGEGTFRDILIATGYAFFPIPLIRLPLILVSHVLTQSEGEFYTIFGTFCYIWVGFLIFMGTLVTHQYSVKKTILTCLLTAVGMGIILFIGLLFFNVIQQMLTFVTTIYREIRFR